MVRLLKLSEDDGTHSMADLLTEEFLNVDSQLLEIVKSTMDMSGECYFQKILHDAYNFHFNYLFLSNDFWFSSYGRNETRLSFNTNEIIVFINC